MISRLNPADIADTCGPRFYQRGLHYWKTDKVIEAHAQNGDDSLLIASKVAGSRGREYVQRIEVSEFEMHEVDIDGECSCPVQFNCKHVVAVLLHVLNGGGTQAAASQEDPVDTWLQTLKAASLWNHMQQWEQYPEDVQFRLLYILEPGSDDQSRDGIRVTASKVRVLKKGGYGKPTAFPLEHTRHVYYVDNFVQPYDQTIARLLINGVDPYLHSYASSYTLKDDIGELVLQKMLLTGRCHWQDKDSSPLRLSMPRTIRFEWRETGGGQQLEHRVDPPVTRITHLNNTWYIDLERAEAGMLEHAALSPRQVAALLKTPVVPDTRLEDVSRRLILDTPEYDLPTPVELDIERICIKDVKPAPRLRLQGIENVPTTAEAHWFHYAQLTFGYGPVQLEHINEQEIVQICQDDKLYRVERDIEAEYLAAQALLGSGLRVFESGSDSDVLKWLFPADSVAHSALQWHAFIEDEIPRLREKGWQVDIDESFRLRFHEPDEWQAELEQEGSDWFALTLGVDIDGERINMLSILVEILSQVGGPEQLRDYLKAQTHFLTPVGEHRWLKIPSERVLPIFDTLVELYDREPLDKDGKLLLSRHQGVQIGDLLNERGLTWRGAEELRRLNERLRDFRGIQQVDPPQGFTAELREYQRQGLSWLNFLRKFEFNGLLADDMGLGKTVQTLAHLLREKLSGRMTQPSLVIAPTSLMGNWRREAQRFTPELDVLVLHGGDRHTYFEQIADHDVVLTTYPLLRWDRKHLLEHSFHYVILDEAQAIKNAKSKTAQIVYELKSAYRLCLTGTPMENHLGELWSMFHFLMPGFLGNLERFNRLFRYPIERQGNESRQDQLRRRIKPFLLRRKKSEVAAELPDKTEIIRSISLENKQRDLYESIRLAMDKKVRREIKNKGLARSHIMILDALLKLRQVCCDPRLLSLPQARGINQSAKLALLMDILPEMVEEGRKILLFSQFTKMLGLIETELTKLDIEYTKLTGQTRKRDEVIARFQDGDTPVFLISLKAGGLGLNLTAADTVIHYDPWWNPAVENQATDRAHRIGQDKAVFVYKLITDETVEDKILALQEKKRALAESIYSGSGKGKGALFTPEELTELLQPLGS